MRFRNTPKLKPPAVQQVRKLPCRLVQANKVRRRASAVYPVPQGTVQRQHKHASDEFQRDVLLRMPQRKIRDPRRPSARRRGMHRVPP